ncbi:response regulator transcription factor [Paenibacillus aurantius]|uniref:Response regulator transcription factor n=1 Tax=Paenibacillus aurantius TaxID=2918900 RepID=A0AA96L9T6_9BACL|nr:response regulator transcription factor [Paenibacillus aurantius]WNQ09188.1 response regulator transcription factor [Paenibacillus aurantius]
MIRILIVEDEEKIAALMEQYLEAEGYEITRAGSGEEALERYAEGKHDLVVLDWMMPRMNGLDACRRLREIGQPGIIMVTAKTEEIDKIVGLESGADDYLTKPFSLRELAARIRSLVRRMNRGGDREKKEEGGLIRRGELVIDEESKQVFLNGKELRLTPTEYTLLHLLATKPGRVFSRMQLLQHAFEEEYVLDERTVDSHISKLRKKIGDDSENPVYIQTVYGFGYRFGASHEH